MMSITTELVGTCTSLLMVAHGNGTRNDREGRESTTPMMVAQFNDHSLINNLKVHSNQESPCHKMSVVLSQDSGNDNALKSPNSVDCQSSGEVSGASRWIHQYCVIFWTFGSRREI